MTETYGPTFSQNSAHSAQSFNSLPVLLYSAQRKDHVTLPERAACPSVFAE